MKRVVFACMVAILAMLLSVCSKKNGGPTGPTIPPDTVKPSLISITPTPGSINLDTGIVVRLTFSEPIDVSLIDNSQIRIFEYDGIQGETVPCVFTSTGNTVIITMIVPKHYNAIYTVDLMRVYDLAGNEFNTRTEIKYGTVPIKTVNPATWGLMIGTSVEQRMVTRLMTPSIDGNYLLAGETAGPWNRNEGLASITADGHLNWYRDEMIDKENVILIDDIAQTSTGGICIVGQNYDQGHCYFTYSAYGVPGGPTFWQYGQLYAHAIIGNEHGTFFVAGNLNSKFGLGEVRYGGYEDWAWGTKYEAINNAYAYDLCRLTNRNFILVGDVDIYQGQVNFGITQVDSAGVISWFKIFGPGRLRTVTANTNDLIIAAGSDGTHMITIGVSVDGTKLWQTDCGIGWPSDIKATSDGGAILIGQPDFMNSGTIIVKLTNTGQIQWRRDYPNFSRGSQICPVSDGYLFTAGNLYKVDLNGNF